MADGYVYAAYELEKVRDPDTMVFVDVEPSLDAPNEPVMPEAVKVLELWTFCSAELLCVVIKRVLKRRSSESNTQIAREPDRISAIIFL